MVMFLRLSPFPSKFLYLRGFSSPCCSSLHLYTRFPALVYSFSGDLVVCCGWLRSRFEGLVFSKPLHRI